MPDWKKNDDILLDILDNRSDPDLAEARFEIYKTYPKLFIATQAHLTTRGDPMDFRKFDHLIEIYKESEAREIITIMKAAQIGFSEWAIVSHLHDFIANGKWIQYILPQREIRHRFVSFRINPVFKKIPFYRNIIDSLDKNDTANFVNSLSRKSFGIGGAVNYVDSGSDSSFVEFPGDQMYVDEVDACPAKNHPNLKKAVQRLQSSTDRKRRYISNPSIVGFGIDVHYNEGSRAEWCFKCPGCNKTQPYSFFGNVMEEVSKDTYQPIDMENYNRFKSARGGDLRIRCIYCKKMFLRGDTKGFWRHRVKHDYHFSYTMERTGVRDSDLFEMISRYYESLRSVLDSVTFYNYDLGKPYTLAGNSITRDMIAASANVYDGIKDVRGHVVYAGIDVGAVHHIVIRTNVGHKDIQKEVFIGTVSRKEDIISILNKYGVNFAVIDQLPEIHMVNELKKQFPNLYSCTFPPGALRPVFNFRNMTVTINRTAAIDKVHERFSDKSIANKYETCKNSLYIDQITSCTKVLSHQRDKFIWESGGRDDHYLLAEAYCQIAHIKALRQTDQYSFIDDALPKARTSRKRELERRGIY